MYKANEYSVWVTLKNDESYVRVFATEAEARTYGNTIWRSKHVKRVDIFKRGFYKKRRNSLLIATAEKE